MAEPGRGQVQRRLAVRKGANHARAPPDLAQDAFQRVVGSDPPPVLLRESVIGERLLDAALNKLGGSGKPLLAQLRYHLPAFSRAACTSSAAWIAFSIAATSRSLGAAHAKNIAVQMNHASLPAGVGKELGGALGKSDAGIGDDQPNALEPALLEMLAESRPARLVLLGAFHDAQNLPITLALTAIATKSETLLTSPAQLRLITMPSR